MQKRWIEVKTGVIQWLSTLDEETLVSLFTFDSEVSNLIMYKTPKELIEEINKELEATGNQDVTWALALQATEETLKPKNKPSAVDSNWLHYGLILTLEKASYQNEAIRNFITFKARNKIKYFLNSVTIRKNVGEMTKVASSLNGVSYMIKEGADFSSVIVQALEINPFRND